MERGFTALSLSGQEVDFAVSSFKEQVKGDPRKAAQEIVEDISRQLPSDDVNPAEYVGIVLVDGLALGELVMKEFSTARKFSFPLVGGAAADELTFSETLVAHDSRISGDAVCVAVMKMKLPLFLRPLCSLSSNGQGVSHYPGRSGETGGLGNRP